MRFLSRVLSAVMISGLALGLSGCGKKQEKKPSPPPQAAAVTIHRATVPITYEYPGRIASIKETQVRARVQGIMLTRNFVEGSLVHKDQLLFQIDPSIYEAEVEAAQGKLDAAKATYTQAILDANRAEALMKQNVSSVQYRDQMFSQRDADKAAVEQADAALRQAQLNLSYTKVTAPITGMTSRETVPEGSLIAINDQMTLITQIDPIYVNFSYSGRDAREIRSIMDDMRAHNQDTDHLRVRVHFGDGKDYPKLGRMDFTSPNVDISTGAVGVRAIIDNPEGVLVPGEFVRAILSGLVMNDAVAIPESALMQDAAGQFVYVINKAGEVERRTVFATRQLEDLRWLIKPYTHHRAETKEEGKARGGVPQAEHFSGLKDGERIMTEGQVRLGLEMAALPEGVKPRVAVTELDGKDFTVQQAMAMQAAAAKAEAEQAGGKNTGAGSAKTGGGK